MIRIILLIITLISQPLLAQSSASKDKVALAKEVWSPVFEEISAADVSRQFDEYRAARAPNAAPLKMNDKQFKYAKELAYETLAEMLTEQELRVQQRLMNTAVGKKVYDNLALLMSGGSPQPLTPSQFLPEEITEWENFMATENENIQLINFKMRRFSEILMEKRSKLTEQEIHETSE